MRQAPRQFGEEIIFKGFFLSAGTLFSSEIFNRPKPLLLHVFLFLFYLLGVLFDVILFTSLFHAAAAYSLPDKRKQKPFQFLKILPVLPVLHGPREGPWVL